MELLLRPWRLYADFDGRSRRTEYFVFTIVRYGVMGLLFAIGIILTDAAQAGSGPMPNIAAGFMIAAVIFLFATIVPGWAVTVR